MKHLVSFALALSCLPALPAMTEDRFEQVRQGREKARPCTTCHGLDGLRQGGEMPVIGGRDYYDLLYWMGSYQRAERFHPAMTVLLQSYDVADMADVAAFFASIEPEKLGAGGPYYSR